MHVHTKICALQTNLKSARENFSDYAIYITHKSAFLIPTRQPLTLHCTQYTYTHAHMYSV